MEFNGHFCIKDLRHILIEYHNSLNAKVIKEYNLKFRA